MNTELNRSVKLLEESLAPTVTGLRKTSLGPLRKDNRYDVSITLGPHEIRKFMMGDGVSIYDETVAADVLTEKSVMRSSLQASNLPWKNKVDGLYTEFFEILQSHSGGHDILDVVSDLTRCCSDALKVIQELKSKVGVSHLEEDTWLENEYNTWRLIFILYQERLSEQNIMQDEGLDDGIKKYFGPSEKNCVQNLFKNDNIVRESQLIIDWLECIAAEKDEEILHFSDRSVGWENTLHQLYSGDTIAFKSSRQIVTQMDPDAPHYQKKSLHDLDMEDEKRLSRQIFVKIRCGQLEEAQKLCKQSGHSWRAALFEGWRLFHNPNIRESYENSMDADECETENKDLEELEGSSNRDIWKNIAIKYCKQDYVNAYDRAAIGSFCGYVDSVLPVCHSWEDNLWAYMRCLIDVRVESEIRDCCIRNKEYIPLPEEYWAQKMTTNEVFTNLESSKNLTVREESNKSEHIIQKCIILDEIPSLLCEFEEWINDGTAATHFLRFIAHLVLFFSQAGRGYNRHIIEKVLEAYIERLMELHETQLIAYYVSKLSIPNQIHLYAKYLEGIIDNETRKTSLVYAEDCGLDVLAITKQVVENIRALPHESEGTDNLQQKITNTDRYKVSALDWLIFYENQRAEALVQTNALIFTFLTLDKLDAAQLAFNKLPSDTVERILREGDVTEDLNQSIKEHFSYKAYLDANEAFSEWFKQSKCKPALPADLPENAQFPEKVAHQHRVSQYKAELERWKLTTAHLANNAKTTLYNVLLFPEGWLVGSEEANYLRSTCIPEVVLLLYSVLSESEQHEECIRLADIIAAEKYGIYKSYSKRNFADILEKLCESSVALLNQRKDPWGNDISA